MSDPDGADGEPSWDDVVDVICVGTGPGVLAYGLCCAAADLDVCQVALPESGDTELDRFLAAMTDDLPASAPEGGPAVTIVASSPASPAARDVELEPFVGQRLREWSALCAASVSGVVFTEIPNLLAPMCTVDGSRITAVVVGRGRPPLDGWLRSEADDVGLAVEGRLAELILVGGRVAGAILETPAGPRRVAATAGIAISLCEADNGWAAESAPVDCDLAVVGRPFGRFARIELLRR